VLPAAGKVGRLPRVGHGFEERSTIGLPEWLGPGATAVLLLVGIVQSAIG
jgi:hypothetical protein